MCDSTSKDNIPGDDLTVKFADEIAKYGNVINWLKARLNNNKINDLYTGDYFKLMTFNGRDMFVAISGIRRPEDIVPSHKYIDFIPRIRQKNILEL